MTSQTCPTCGKDVDPLRARSVSVRDGKVVAYCSAPCAQAAESRPVVMPAALAAAVAPPVAPIAAVPAPVVAAPPAPVVVAPAGKDRSKGRGKASTKGPASTDAATAPATAPAAGTVAAPAAGTAAAPAADAATGTAAAAAAATGAALATEATSGTGGTARRARPAADGASPPRPSNRLALGAVIVLGTAGAFLAYRFLLGTPAPAPGPAAPAADLAPAPKLVDAPSAVVAAPPVERAAAVERATAVLVATLGAGTPRIQRVAAAALARTHDATAIGFLADALTRETVDTSRLDLAYALARAGDARGAGVLVEATRSARRDVKLQAGRLLALLGDARGAPVLAGFLTVSQLRTGAAEQLAYLAEPRAITVLEEVHAAPERSADDRARAAIALAVAGQASVLPELRALLPDARFNAAAASALAGHRDPAARPVLLEQLEVPSLRVEAARSLRRLDPAFDAGPHLAPLLAALASAKDTEQVQAAEAILLLAGDAAWSERP